MMVMAYDVGDGRPGCFRTAVGLLLLVTLLIGGGDFSRRQNSPVLQGTARDHAASPGSELSEIAPEYAELKEVDSSSLSTLPFVNCNSPTEWTLRAWRTTLRQCGLQQTVEYLRNMARSPPTTIPQDLLEEFIRPILISFPNGISWNMVIPTSTSQTVFYERPSLAQADAGHCFFSPTVEKGLAFKCLPSLIIIGFQRAATRELFDWIRAHPDVKGYGSRFDRGATDIGANSVETHYFDSLPESSSFHKLQPQQRQDVLGRLEESWDSVYLHESPNFPLAKALMTRFLFEKTPAYADETDPRAIRQLLPNVKMLATLREPAARLWSSYWMHCRTRPPCSLNLFVKSILEPAERCNLGSRTVSNEGELAAAQIACFDAFPSGYELRSILVGYYEVYLRRYERAFVGTNASLLVIFAESLRDSPFEVMTDIEQHNHLSEFDYRSVAKYDDKSHVFAVSSNSKGLHGKPREYVSFEDIPRAIKTRMVALYSDSTRRLKLYLNSPSSFLKLSHVRPAWIRG